MTLPSRSVRLEPLPGYTPTIGRLVGILTYARHTTLTAVEGLSAADLDHLHDDSSNSIGALLAHIAAVDRGYQHIVFDERPPTAEETAALEPALTLGAEARRITLAGLASRDDEWLEQPLRAAPAMNAHWAWFHVAEDEINHRGQIRWLRSRLPSASR